MPERFHRALLYARAYIKEIYVATYFFRHYSIKTQFSLFILKKIS